MWFSLRRVSVIDDGRSGSWKTSWSDGDEAGRVDRVLAGAGVARVARVRAAGDLHADAVAGVEAVGGRPQLEPHGGDPVGVALRLVGRQADEAVADVQRRAVGLHVAHAHEHVGVAAARAQPDVGVDGAERVEVARRAGRR